MTKSKRSGEPKVTRTFSISDSLYNDLKAYAKSLDRSTSYLAEILLDAGLATLKEKEQEVAIT